MGQSWAVYGSFKALHNKRLGLHWYRGDAEAEAQKLRRLIGGGVLIRVVWEPQGEHE